MTVYDVLGWSLSVSHLACSIFDTQSKIQRHIISNQFFHITQNGICPKVIHIIWAISYYVTIKLIPSR